MIHFVPSRKSGVRGPGSGEILFVESGVVGFGIRNSARGIRNPTNEWNPETPSTDKECGIQYMEPGIRNLQIGIQYPRLRLITDGLHEEIQG